MSAPRRRALPDNLDPLVDTLSNVVGILVVVIALTQLELGDALARVAAEALAGPARAPIAENASPQPEASRSAEAAALAARIEQVQARSGPDLERAGEILRRTLERLESPAPERRFRAEAGADEADRAVRAREALEARVARARASLEAARQDASNRRAHAAALEKVPRQLVARLPDPEIVEGRESWLLVRYGRLYLVDREALFAEGRRAIERIVPDGAARPLRPDEFGSVAHYLRKTDIGLGAHRWLLATEPDVRLTLVWRTRNGGIERSRIADAPELEAWLARRDPEVDTIRFHVWSDSFETYLEARARVEAARFRAGWRGHEADSELEIGLRFGEADPEIRRLRVD
ncbi:MAG: hypothetical protein R3F21_07220 [Myxococcota bacterium]